MSDIGKSPRCRDGRHEQDGLAVGGACQDAGSCWCSCHDDAAHGRRLRDLAAADPAVGREAIPEWPVRDFAAHLRSATSGLATGLSEVQAEAVVRLVIDLGWRPVWTPQTRPDCSPVPTPEVPDAQQ